MAEGDLPNLAALAAEGTAGPLVSTDPAESAAGWAAINTGANPARNGVASFVKRVFADGQPIADLAHVSSATRPLDTLAPKGLVGAYSRHGRRTVTAFAAIAVAALLFLVLRLALRIGGATAFLLSSLIGAAVGFGSWRMGARIPREVPSVYTSQVELDGFWLHAARAGQPSVALDAALAFGRPGVAGARTLFGLGLPDLRGASNGEWAIYTTDELASGVPPKGDTGASDSGTGTVYRVDWRAGRLEAELYGPLDFVERGVLQSQVAALDERLEDQGLGFKAAEELRLEREGLVSELAEYDGSKSYKHRVTLPLVVERTDDGGYDVTLGSTTQNVAGGAWSAYYPLRFDLSPLIKAHAVTRVRVVSEEPFRLYVDALHIDPAHQPFWQPVTEPPSFGAELVRQNGGPFETLGWGCLTNQQKDELLPLEVFLEDLEFTHAYRRRLTLAQLARKDWRLLFSVFTFTDRMQHILYRCYDPEHPMHDPVEAAATVTLFGETVTLADAIPAAYRQMDKVVGEVRAALGPNDTLFLCADHGFTSYRRGLIVNNWLAAEGFLTLREDLTSTSRRDLASAVDWSRTEAYSLGLGMVYLNLVGRERQGIVRPEDAEAVLARIRARFLALRDGEAVVGSSARSMAALYEGPHAWGSLEYPCADLMLGLAEHYRVAWTSVSGNLRLTKDDLGRVIVGDPIEDNTSAWSGDHASNDPEVVTGIFFSNRRVRTADGAPFSVLDIAPTVLEAVGAPMVQEFDRPPLIFE